MRLYGSNNIIQRMDIRTRLSLALVFFSLASMTLLGAFAYTTSADLLREISLRQLGALAEGKKRDIIKVYDGWKDNLRLVKDRTQLRASIREYVEQGSQDALDHVERIIQGVTIAITDIDKLIVFDVDGNEIASFGHSSIKHDKMLVGRDITYAGTYIGTHPDRQGSIQVALNTGVHLGDDLIGSIKLIIDAAALFAVTSDYTGLGETGEASVVKRIGDDMLQVLNPPRHQVEGYDGRQSLAAASDGMRQVFSGSDVVAAETHTDYRGKHVWSATRFLPALDWVLEVKVDVSEEEKRAQSLRASLFDIAVALSAFAIIGGALLGFYLARPIHNLAIVVERIQRGESHIRAEVKGNDEIAYLAATINEYLDDIESERNDTTSQLAQRPPDNSHRDA